MSIKKIDDRIIDIIKKWSHSNSAPFFAEFMLNVKYVERYENVMDIGYSGDDVHEIFEIGDTISIKDTDNVGVVVKATPGSIKCKMNKWVHADSTLISANGVEYNVESAGCFTMGIGVLDRRICLYSNPFFVESLTREEVEGVLVHEIYHIITITQGRSILGAADHRKFNIASDVVIDEDLLNTKIEDNRFTLPSFALTLQSLENYEIKENGIVIWKNTKKFTDSLTTECVYNYVCDMYDRMPKQPEGGSGEDEEPGEGGLKTLDDHSGHRDITDEEKEVMREMLEKCHARGYGRISGNLEDVVSKILKPVVNWKKMLRKALTSCQLDKMFSEQTWNRLSRKYRFLQGKKWFSKEIIIAVDTSGSTVCRDMMCYFFTEIETIVKDMSSLILIQADSDVKDVNYKYKKGDWKRINILGCGGTDVQPVFDLIKKDKKLKGKTVIYFTDGEFSHNFNTHGADVIWCVVNTDDNYQSVPKGKNIYVKQRKK